MTIYLKFCFKTLFFLTQCIFFFSFCLKGTLADVNVVAPISLYEPLNAIGKLYEKHTHEKVTINFAASGILAQQIIRGYPTDIFISAHKNWIEQLNKKKLLTKKTQFVFAKNTLVLAIHKNYITTNTPLSYSTILLPSIKKIAMGDYQYVPNGTYAYQFLQKVHLWKKLKNKIIFTAHAKQALEYIKKEYVQAAFLYYSDAQTIKENILIKKIPHSEVSIKYYASLINKKHTPQILSFFKFLKNNQSKKILAQFSF